MKIIKNKKGFTIWELAFVIFFLSMGSICFYFGIKLLILLIKALEKYVGQ